MSAGAARRRQARSKDPFAALNGRRILAPRIVPPAAHPCLGGRCDPDGDCVCPARCTCRCVGCGCTVSLDGASELNRP